MTQVTQPNLIEVSDFRGGWSPDGVPESVDGSGLLDVLNLVPDVQSGALVTRKGFLRLREKLVASPSHYVKHVFNFLASDEHYIVTVVTDGTANANNVRLYAIKLSDMTVTRMDTSGTTWSRPLANHWGMGIDNIWYGGSRGNEMYSWDPSGPTWDAEAGIGNWKDWAALRDDDVDLTTEYPKDYAWLGNERVVHGGDVYMPADDIRYKDWEEDQHYHRGDLVSRKHIWDTTNSYYKSFRCIDAHVANDVDKRPGTGADTDLFWEQVKLGPPTDEDGNTTDDWLFVPVAAKTSVAGWHADRLFMRYDDQGDRSRLLYSAPVRTEKGKDVPDVVFDPKNFAPGSSRRGAGGGWMSFNDGTHHGTIEALRSYGQYLIVFKRRVVWAVSGSDDSTWNVRRIAVNSGIVGGEAHVEHDGLVYFLSDDGLSVTDGTTVEDAPGNEKVQNYLRGRMDELMPNADYDPTMHSFDRYIFISLPDTGASAGSQHVTLVYEPVTGSFWKTDLPIGDAANYRISGISHLAISTPPTYDVASNEGPLVYEYTGLTDDDGGSAADKTQVAVSWYMRTAWWPFGSAREDRRIRRVWASIKGAATYTLTAYRNWSNTAVETTVRTIATTDARFIEGEYFADSHAVSFKLAGSAPATVIAMAVDTEPRRTRYHQGGQS